MCSGAYVAMIARLHADLADHRHRRDVADSSRSPRAPARCRARGRPEPPYSSGTDMPSTPISASCCMFSHGKRAVHVLDGIAAEVLVAERRHGADQGALLVGEQ